MTEHDKNIIRAFLKNLVEEIESRALNARLEACPDEADFAAQLVRHHLDVALGERGLAQKRAAEAALARLDSHDFGICLHCGDDIPAERIKAQPTTVLCVACQEEREKELGACA